MSDENDWFERKLREREESESSSETKESHADPSADGESGVEPSPDDEEADTEVDEPGAEQPSDVLEGPSDDDEHGDPFGGFDGGSTGGEAVDRFEGAERGDQLGSGESNDPSEGGGDDDGLSGPGGDDPFGGGGGGDDPFGGGGGGDDDPFGGDEFGFTDFEGQDRSESPTFDEDEAEFDSDIERVTVGIDGLDEMILGGVPRRALMSVIGSAGTGKTTFALQFLNDAVEDGDKAVYLTLEESQEAILSTAEEKGWPFRRYADEGRLAIVAIDPIDMANSLASIRNDLPRLVAEFGADRLVLDSVSLLEMMYDHPAKRRSEVFDFTRALKEAGVTTLLTSEASDDNPYASRYGIVEYLTDAVFVLQYVRSSNYQETRLAVEIQKIRDANHSRETKPYEITNDGISVYRQANIF